MNAECRPNRGMTQHRSLSLTFQLTAEEAANLAAQKLDGKRPRIESRVETWFDTHGNSLRAAGLTLSVLAKKKQFFQRAREWPGDQSNEAWGDREIATGAPDIELLPAAFRQRWAEVGDKLDLVPLFQTNLKRQSRVVAKGRSNIGAALDLGPIVADEGRLELRELRLGLINGRPGDLFAVARELSEAIPMRIEFASRVERGFLAREGRLGLPVGKTVLRLRAEMSSAEGFVEIARACLRQFSLNLPAFREGNEIEATHQTRVAIRRLRSALSLFAPILRDEFFQRWRMEIKWLFDSLGSARDLDVLREHFMAAGADDRAKALEPRRRRAHGRLAKSLASPRLGHLLFDFAEWIETGPWRRSVDPKQTRDRGLPIASFVARRMSKRRETFIQVAAQFDGLGPDGLHALRIEAKKLRYGAEFIEPLARHTKSRKRCELGHHPRVPAVEMNCLVV